MPLELEHWNWTVLLDKHIRAAESNTGKLRIAVSGARGVKLKKVNSTYKNIFISHSTIDAELAERMEVALTGRPWNRDDVDVFCTAAPDGGVPLDLDLVEILSRISVSTCLIVVCTAKALLSPWVWMEVGAALQVKARVLLACAGVPAKELPAPFNGRLASDLTDQVQVSKLLDAASGRSAVLGHRAVRMAEQIAMLARQAARRHAAAPPGTVDVLLGQSSRPKDLARAGALVLRSIKSVPVRFVSEEAGAPEMQADLRHALSFLFAGENSQASIEKMRGDGWIIRREKEFPRQQLRMVPHRSRGVEIFIEPRKQLL